MRKDVAFACEQFQVSERRACKLLGVDRGSYRYEPRPDLCGKHWLHWPAEAAVRVSALTCVAGAP
jgi:hypothetical protein